MYPIDALTQEDKETIFSYIDSYCGATPRNIEDILYSWNKNKIKLFKIMGGKLRVTKKFKIEPTRALLFKELEDIYPEFEHRIGPFLKLEPRYYGCKFTSKLESYLMLKRICQLDMQPKTLFRDTWVLDNELKDSLTFHLDYPEKGKKLYLPEGMKTMRAIRKFCEFVGFFDYCPEGEELYEEFRNLISDIRTRNYIEGTMTMSIHPIDYLTVSHNNNDWSSCLSWNGGCYCGGTVELMNSNLAIVCYMESKAPFIITGGQTKCASHEIPNKSWRCIYYAHKNILLSGNPYPYYNKTLVNRGLDFLYELVYNNMHWDYKYKKQIYSDMEHCSNNEFTRQKFDRHISPVKDILVYTYGLYNDYCGDLDYPVYCYRNPVKDRLRLCLSGRATCLRCGKPIDFADTDSKYYRFNDDLDFKSHGHDDMMCELCMKMVGGY